MTSVIFFGSFQHYSTIVLDALYRASGIKVLGVVTAPPRPAGRGLKLTQTHTHLWGEAHQLPVFTPESLDRLPPLAPDFIVVAGYRLLLPPAWLKFPKVAALNLHASLLPAYAGPSPAEWAMLMGETITGMTLIKMSQEYDRGPIIAQKKLSILPTDNRLTLYQKLYELGAKMLVEALNTKYLILNTATKQPKLKNPIYAKRLNRQDGYVHWPLIQATLSGRHVPVSQRPGIFAATTDPWPKVIERAVRALADYPGVWTQIPTPSGHKRLKLLSSRLEKRRLILDTVQLEGKTPAPFTP